MMLDKVKIAQSFSRSAATYDSVAYVQRAAGLTLLEMLKKESFHKFGDHWVVDLGCGTGFFSPHLKKLFPQSSLLSIDLAEGMLRYIKQQQHDHSLACGDAEQLPVANHQISTVYSNFALQWCENLPQLFQELSRVLTSDGMLALTTLGPKTLWELKSAWAQVDNLTHVNHFYSADKWRHAILENGFSIAQHKKEENKFLFDDLKHLVRELKCLGASNMNSDQRPSLTGRKAWKDLEAAYFALGEKLVATYEIDYWVLKPLK